MRPTFAIQQDRAFSRIDLVVVVFVLLLVLALLPAIFGAAKRRELRIQCANNLKQINDAFRSWEDDHEAYPNYPGLVSVTNGGTMEMNNGTNAWINFAILSNDFESNTPEVFYCPADTERSAAPNFNNLQGKISYFINLNAKVYFPAMPLDGDDNFATNGVPAKSGFLDLSPGTLIKWTRARHKFVGNIGFADGSVSEISDSALRETIMQTGPTTNGAPTNRIVIP
jgi:prepilin-type processing-associated H-X9-DG protein